MELFRAAAITVLVGLAGAPPAARAEAREVYVLVSLEPQLGWYTEPLAGQVSAAQPGIGARVSAYYGLTHSLHVGGDVHFSLSRDVSFPNATVALSDGTPSTGTVYSNFTSVGVNGLILYRHNTGWSLAPVARFELGLASLSYTNIQQGPNGQPYLLSLGDSSELALELGAALLLEYRISDHLVVSAGVAVSGHPKARAPWSAAVPLSVGWVW